MPVHLTHADRRTLLQTYLNDHLAGASAGESLVRRAQGSNEGTELGAALAGLITDIKSDAAALRDVLARLDTAPARPKLLAAAVAERLGRFKLNGQLVGYSDLSRLVELEGLCGGVELKRCLWLALKEVQSVYPQLAGVDFDRLADRARAQREALEQHRLAAARIAFLPEP